MNEIDHCNLVLLKQQQERPENSGLNRDSNPGLCNATPVLYPWSYQANIMWVNYKPIDAEIDGDNRNTGYDESN